MPERVQEALMGWIDLRLDIGDIKQVTWRNYRCHINDFTHHVGNKPVDQVTPADIEQWIRNTRTKQGHRLKPKSLKCRVDVIRAYYRWARARGIVDSDPTATVVKVKVPAVVPKALTHDTVLRVLDVADLRTRTIVVLAWRLGLRRSEIAGLDSTDWDAEAGTLVVCGKGGQQRVLPVVGQTATQLETWLRTIPQPGPMFPSNHSASGRTHPNTISWWIKKAAKTAGVPHVHAHLFRHTNATDMCRQGVPVNTVSAWLGHASLQSTTIYTKATAGDLFTAAERMDERATGIEPASSAWKAEVLAIELRPQEPQAVHDTRTDADGQGNFHYGT